MIYVPEVNKLLEIVRRKSLITDWSKLHRERQRRRYFHKADKLSWLLPSKLNGPLVGTPVPVLDLNPPLRFADFSTDCTSESNV